MTGWICVVVTDAALPAQGLVSFRCRLKAWVLPLTLVSGTTVAIRCVGWSL